MNTNLRTWNLFYSSSKGIWWLLIFFKPAIFFRYWWSHAARDNNGHRAQRLKKKYTGTTRHDITILFKKKCFNFNSGKLITLAFSGSLQGPILSSGSAWSQDQGSNMKRSRGHSFASTVIIFCTGREGLSLPSNTKYCGCRCKTDLVRASWSWALIPGSSWAAW